MTSRTAVVLAHHDAEDARALLDELCDAYADAYGVEPGKKAGAFRDRALHAFKIDGFDLVAAHGLGVVSLCPSS